MSASRIGAVVLNGSPTGLCALRALARRGIPTAVVQTKDNHIAAYSRWATDTHNLFEFQSESDTLLDLLSRKVDHWRGRVLIPTSDRTLTALARNREELSRNYRVPVPPWEITQRVLQKDVTYAAAREVGVDIPRDYGPAVPSIIDRDDIEYPVIVKPVTSHDFVTLFGQKLFVATNRDELAAAIAKLATAGLEASVNDLIPGPDSEFYNCTMFLDEHGDPVGQYNFRKLRKSPPRYGVGRVAVSEAVPELTEPTLELLRKLEWTGLASAEYKRDSRDGRYRLMEVNGRCYLTMGLALRAGIDYPFLIWAKGAGIRIPRMSENGWRGAWIDLRADLAFGVFLHHMEKLSWRELVAPYRGQKTFAIWSASDPKPFAAAQVQLARKGIQVLRTRNGRASLQGQIGSAIPVL